MQTETKDGMREKILEAALKRFTHYGASKTTMNEIADDLHCSKASLYYYFPDKNAMHFAVLQKIGEVYFQEMEKETRQITTAAEALMNIIAIRQNFVQKFCRLELFKILQDASLAFHDELVKAKEREVAIHAAIINAGIERGEFHVADPNETARLLAEALMGLRYSVLDHVRSDSSFTDEEFELVIKKQQLLATIFIKGLKQP
ncbi:TetR/AcrR family transcriptional regulator [Chitinophaga defluvii]|uniref:TetR/AcrR family transcriptional regulator n=1 Tax=Chitinophaga defluvii TaxID=3163343 RepID=A0ABV2T8I0_9BACT